MAESASRPAASGSRWRWLPCLEDAVSRTHQVGGQVGGSPGTAAGLSDDSAKAKTHACLCTMGQVCFEPTPDPAEVLSQLRQSARGGPMSSRNRTLTVQQLGGGTTSAA